MILRARLLRAAAAGASLACLAGSCRRGAPPLGPFPDAPVVLISIDTLRADRLPLYGYRQGSTPALDALGREGLVFEEVHSHVPLTFPAHASLFTGLLPPRHGVRDNVGFTLAATHKTLAARLREAGRPTGAAVSAFVMRAATGLAAGFDTYDDALDAADRPAATLGAEQRDGAAAVESLARWSEAHADRPFFAFLHLYEPHTPYTPPARHQHHGHPYDGEVAYADELVGRFMDRLRAAGAYDRAIVAVTSDHGEGLGDHGEEEHGFLLYRESVRVPLVLRLPGGVAGGRRLAGVAGLTDLTATLLDLAGLASVGLDGTSLLPALRSAADAAAVDEGLPRSARELTPVYAETYFPRFHFGWSELLSVSDGRFRYIHGPRPELFDVAADPGERRDLVAERPAVAAAMRSWLEDRGAIGAVATPAPVDAGLRERLQALGYVGGSYTRPPGSTLADPKDKIAVYEGFRRAFLQGAAARREGRCVEAIEAFARAAELQRRQAGLVVRDLHAGRADCLARLGRAAEAEKEFQAEITAFPFSSEGRVGLAMLYRSQGRDARAREVLAGIVTAHPQPGASEYWSIVRTLGVLGDREAAHAWAQKARALFPQDPRFR